MLRLKRVAVTGGLACGKSSVCRIFSELGAFTVNADEIVHQQLSLSTTLGQQVVQLIGSEIVVNHQIDRSLIAKKVFENPSLLLSLEELIHPEIKKELEKLYKEKSKQGLYPLFVAEIPLLFEMHGRAWFPYDYSIVVIADPSLCHKRFQEATGYTQEEYKRRAARQLDLQEKTKRADFVIANNGTLKQLYIEVSNLYAQLILCSPTL